MKRINSLVMLKKEKDNGSPFSFWKAYFRGTSNRVKRDSGLMVSAYLKQSDLRFDLLNNPMERGVIVN